MNKLTLTLAGALVVTVAACSQKSEPQQAATTQPAEMAPAAAPAAMPAPQGNAAPQNPMAAGGHPAGAPMQMNAAPQPGANSGEGKILQSMHASSYTYMEVDVGGKKVWIATNAMAVNTGDTVRWRDGAAMKNFTSQALHRTFDEILFVSYAEIAK